MDKNIIYFFAINLISTLLNTYTFKQFLLVVIGPCVYAPLVFGGDLDFGL